MLVEFIIKGALVVFGAALIAGGIVALVKAHQARTSIWAGAAVAAGAALWGIVLFTTAVASVAGS